ncbi:hypothetical protein Bbelb_350580 [Branchiostoma belcheri]|nr:hypothetical protein Bbelb_350580 [Branchiostoma belcheri]
MDTRSTAAPDPFLRQFDTARGDHLETKDDLLQPREGSSYIETGTRTDRESRDEDEPSRTIRTRLQEWDLLDFEIFNFDIDMELYDDVFIANITQSIVDDITASPSPKRRRKNDGGIEPVSHVYLYTNDRSGGASPIPGIQCSLFTKCTICVRLERKLAKARDQVKRKAIKLERDQHDARQMAERTSYYHRREISRKEPEKYLSLIIDGMDQAKTFLPHFIGDKSKSMANISQQAVMAVSAFRQMMASMDLPVSSEISLQNLANRYSDIIEEENTEDMERWIDADQRVHTMKGNKAGSAVRVQTPYTHRSSQSREPGQPSSHSNAICVEEVSARKKVIANQIRNKNCGMCKFWKSFNLEAPDHKCTANNTTTFSKNIFRGKLPA